MKEYGPHANIVGTVIRESIRVLIIATVLSAFGGIALETIKTSLAAIIPLIILLPTLNDLIGDYGTIFSAHISLLLHERRIRRFFAFTPELREIFSHVMLIAFMTAIISVFSALIIAHATFEPITVALATKLFFIVIIDILLIIPLLFILTVFAGVYYYRKKEDPNNLLIPLTTSIADLGNIIVIAVLLRMFF